MKRILLIALMAVTATLASYAQTAKADKQKIYEKVEVMPKFPGGNLKMIQFITANLKYPEKSIKRNEQGRVMVKFVIEPDGSISEVATLNKVSPELDEAAINVVKAMPKWTPGKVKGQNVRTRFVMPVIFSLK